MARTRRDILRYIEAGLVGLFFVQAVRFLYGTLYAHLGSLDQLIKTVNPGAVGAAPGVIQPLDLQIELAAVGIALFLPLLALLIGRSHFGALVGAVGAVGRVYMTFAGHSVLGVVGAALAAGCGALYAASLARRNGDILPALFIIGFALDMLLRTFGGSVDPSWDGRFLGIQAALSMLLFVAILLNIWLDSRERRNPDYQPPPRTHIALWGAVALGGLFYVEFALFALPNAAGRRAGLDGNAVAPFLVAATLLPLVAVVREFIRRFLVIFDAQWRGWVWLLLTGLLVIIGFRFSGPISAGALVGAQFLVCISFWWLVQPAAGRVNFSGPALVIGLALFLALSGVDYFTYEYAFVRNLQEPFASGLRALRGLGLGLVLICALLINLPAIVARQRLPFRGGRYGMSLSTLLLVILAAGATFTLIRPVVIKPEETDHARITTLNLHGGYSLYFDENLSEIAAEISKAGADVVLLQEAETGRLISYGIDQVAWLAQAVGMQAEFFPTNEALQGLAILTRFPVEARGSQFLCGVGKQTGVQFVRLRTPEGGALNIYNTQLGLLLRESALTPEAQQQDQLKQLDEVFSLIAANDPQLAARTIFGGTFYNTPGSDVYNKAAAYFSDPFTGLAAEKAITWRLINNVTSRVDYLWLRNVTALSAGVSELQASTHNMPVLEISLK